MFKQSFYGRALLFTMGLFCIHLSGCKKSLTEPSSGGQGKYKIAFVHQGMGTEIYVMNSDSTNKMRLTIDTMNARYPVWSPDGTKIVFVQHVSGRGWEIYTMNSDGSNTLFLSTNGGDDWDERPIWSPDGMKIITSGMYMMNADGTNQHLLASGRSPAWSKDGTKIAFLSGPDVQQIFVINADGTNQHQLTNEPTGAGQLCWSPDGNTITFVASREGKAEIMSVNSDGSNLIRLTNDPGADVYPNWNPDGTKLLFLSNRGGHYDIYTMNSDGSNQTRITDDSTASNSNREKFPPPSWSPDGNSIVYVHGWFSNDFGIFVINSDGTKQQRLTAGFDLYPTWSPVRMP